VPEPGTPTELEFDPVRHARALFGEVPWRRYAAIGDSTTEGLGDPTPGYPDMGWAEMIATALRAVRPDLEYLNVGKRFLRAKQVRESQLSRVLEFEPDLVSVVIGGNDMLPEHFSAASVEEEFEGIVAPLREHGATVFGCTMFNIFSAGVMHPDAVSYLEPRYLELNDAVRRVAKRHDMRLVDLAHEPVSRRPEIYSKDLQHATRLGHAATAVLMLEELARSGPASAPEHPPEAQ
jgi:lysophospholipase L1-like esterase